MNTIDTICAICTGIGGAISIIRISGPDALKVGSQVWHGKTLLAEKPFRRMLYGQSCSDPALGVYMPSPNSYTGDDVVEIHCHGGALAAKNVLTTAIKAGARLADPGEFTFRAFVNGKLDLTQAEAVCDIISAHSQMALRLAERQIAGLLSNKITKTRSMLTDILAECESRLDFVEENLDWLPPASLNATIKDAKSELTALAESAKSGMILREGIRVVLAGRPNAGKSSLLNLLLDNERAIVSQIPGTTRDTIEESTQLRGIPVRLTDTAGLRDSADHIEVLGISRTRHTIGTAQLILWVLDASEPNLDSEITEMEKCNVPPDRVIAVWNKIDLVPQRKLPELQFDAVKISVIEKYGIDHLLNIFEKKVWGKEHTEEPEFAVNSRHAALIAEAVALLPEVSERIDTEEWELAAVPLRQAIASLGAITGETVSPDILENIFSRFCIGK
ncbi:MAG: tRNA uridine-5-carboxymethylaminomethyl(34) synthesis GTPase MnmE [Lentisphaerae bacterium]|jgi:tRNA modification GTPase|nr:tRNA uridine-5-carboxymethylaminomethyl(34) synthesis GTPase MnmE [Victivallaceae bacterium]MDD3703733.1 tRNA uridine-5-carboxymethylaminomethyl(34) synthesis GTPase MnmE [Victivallaceae bacterium]MDD5662814.1 tRNA uridine-5-carboxymethylaminomethyl(34) synthesis GTPase MnmE [Victivallaceae bacterium]NLK84149.1 tRNA uridine-5-carboxymethylaminomethyl(34) synthesis GTPase MnmE [Lentisphaerota bacterium]